MPMHPRPAARFEPMTVGMILDTTVRLYLQNAALMIGIIALAYLPYLVVVLATEASLQRGESLEVSLVGLLTTALWALMAQPLSVGAATYAVSEQYLERRVTAWQALRVAWQRYSTLLWAQAVASLVIMAGFMLLIVPGILWALSYALISPVIMLEAVNAGEGRQRSWELVAGFRGKVFWVLLVVTALTSVVTLALRAVLPVLLDVSTQSGQMLSQVIIVLVSYLVIPVPTIATVLLYYDLRIRKEGFDLEMLSRALSQS